MLTFSTTSFCEKTLGALFLISLFCQTSAMAATYYISPTGNDSNIGTSATTPWKTFSKAFSTMGGGNELVLLDGTYSVANGTGYISYLGTNSAQPPNGTSITAMTYIHAKTPGNVNVIGGLFLGRSSSKNSYIKIEGITFDSGTSGTNTLYNTSYIYIKNSGFHGVPQDGGEVFGIGTNDHTQGNTYNLIEDVWVWGKNRIIAANYRADNNVWRRVFVRGDGCNTAPCSGEGNPNVGITVYESKNVSLQNVMVVDRILGGGSPYSDFAVAMHTSSYLLTNNEWLGCVSLNSPDAGVYFEPDDAGPNTTTIRNMVVWNSTDDGINLARVHNNFLLENITSGLSKTGSNFRIAPGVSTGTLRNIIAYNAKLWNVNSSTAPSYVDAYLATDSTYNQTSCSTGCKTTNPLTDGNPPSLKYITRIETGTALKGTGYNGQDYGANVVYKYGVDGTFYGQTGYNTLTMNVLWPWPNENRIKAELCASSNRGFCLASSLSAYVWGTLGNPMPSDIGGTTGILSEPTNLRIENK